MNCKERINQTIDYIGQHLDEELSLEKLSEIACFSKYHFHRLFTIYAGIPLKSYIKWLKLKRAAHHLTTHKEEAITNIALGAGYESHEAFSRAFKQASGQSPREFRGTPDWSTWENPPHSEHIRGKTIMNITIKELATQRLALVEHHGDPLTLSNTLDKLISWATAQPIDLKPKAGQAFGLGYHDPKEVPAEEFRFDLALKVPENFTLNNAVREKILPQGRYASAMHKGSRDNMGETIDSLCRDWLPESGEELADFPCIFCYHNFDHEVAETELLTEIRVLLK